MPERAPRHAELEAGDDTTGLHDPRERAQGGRGIGDVAEQVREREGVERLVGVRELLGTADHERQKARADAAAARLDQARRQLELTRVQTSFEYPVKHLRPLGGEQLVRHNRKLSHGKSLR